MNWQVKPLSYFSNPIYTVPMFLSNKIPDSPLQPTMMLSLICFAAMSILAIFSLPLAFWVAEGDNGSVAVEVSSVLTLDASNFSDTVTKHHFIVVEFYAPWCEHCKKLAPEYEKAALSLSKHDPPIILAKVDATGEQNKELASNYEINGYPTLIILKSEGKIIQDYKGPYEAEGMIEYLKKQVGPASLEIKMVEDASNLLNKQSVFIVGIFLEFSGEEFTNFTSVAEKLRSDYDFRHTLDAKILPHGGPAKNLPSVRLFKPFDELFVDFKDFDVDALEGFIISSSVPIITNYNTDPKNYPYLLKFFNRPTVKVMLFLDFSNEHIDVFKSKYYETVENNKEKNISFLIGDLNSSKNAFEFYGLKEDQVPLLFIRGIDDQKYLKPHLQPNQISLWLNEYKDGLLSPFFKSLPIPETNDEPVKIVVADNFHDMVFASRKNVLLEFYSPQCGFCTELVPILDEVAVSFQNDVDVLVAKMDATKNGFPNMFEVKGFPMMYLYTISGKIVKFDGYRTSEDIINFIQENRDEKPYSQSTEDEL